MPKPQSRPEFFENSAKLDINKNEGKSSKIDFEPRQTYGIDRKIASAF
jgi:hypothetical protein